MNISRPSPSTLAAALEISWRLTSEGEREQLRTLSLDDARTKMHLMLGAKIRAELNLWSADAWDLFEDINNRMPDVLALSADSASDALIAALWQRARE